MGIDRWLESCKAKHVDPMIALEQGRTFRINI